MKISEYRWAICVFIFCSIPMIAFAQKADIPVYNMGDTWSYKTTDLWTRKISNEYTQTIIGTQGDFVRLKIDTRTADATTGLLGPLTSNTVTQRADFTFTYPAKGAIGKRVTFAFPLETNKKWSDNFVSTIRQPNGQVLEFSNSSNAVISAYEEVAVPAGKFKAYKVIHTNQIADAAGLNAPSIAITTYWYSPEAKRYVKVEDEFQNSDGTPGAHTVTELQSFKLAE